jgi:predicted transcriptional regulator
VNSVSEAEETIDKKHQSLIEQFETLCKRKDNEYKKEVGQELYSELLQFYDADGKYDVSRFKNLSYEEQKIISNYIEKKRESLPTCMKDFIESGAFCDNCWGVNR